eukprot:4948232-Prymnesium_polylepis.1
MAESDLVEKARLGSRPNRHTHRCRPRPSPLTGERHLLERARASPQPQPAQPERPPTLTPT